MPSDRDPTDKKYGIHEGEVIDNIDPLRLHRVRVRIPGMFDDPGSGWVLPAGTFGGGAAHFGGSVTPPISATVYVFFLGGDVGAPRYMGGHWGAPGGVPEAPGPVGGYARVLPTGEPGTPEELSPEDAAKIHVIFESAEWIVYVDDRPDPFRAFHIHAKKSGDGITIGGGGNNVEIRATALLSVRADGTGNIQAGTLVLNERAVAVTGKPI